MPQPLYFRHPSSLEHHTGPHPEGPGRIPAIERAMDRHGWCGYRSVEAPSVEMAQLTAIHPEGYVEALQKLSAGGGGTVGADTVVSSGSFGAALHAAGGACAMVDALMGGDAGVAFCGLRPPGHHAEPSVAMGFCLFNNVAVAAQYALDSGLARRVFIFDWDVHHGNGTNDIFHARRDVLFASIHQWPLYPGTGPLSDAGAGEGEGYTINLPVAPGSGGEKWLALVQHVVMEAALAFEPDLVLVSAGFDAHRDDPLGSCMLETGSYASMTRHVTALGRAVGAPVGAVLEGGYDLDALADSTVATLEALSGLEAAESVDFDPLTERVRREVARHWPLGR